MKNILSLFGAVVLASSFTFQAQTSNDAFWSPINENQLSINGKRQIIPQKYSAFHLNATSFKNTLFSAPHEKNTRIDESSFMISLPLPNGEFQRFKVIESPVMAEELSASFPNIKTFSVKGIDDVYANGKLDWTEFGFHGMILSINGDFFIDPYCLGNTVDYVSYYTNDFIKPASETLPEAGLLGASEGQKKPIGNANQTNASKTSAAAPATCVGAQLRTYRLAVACTKEYAVAATGQSAANVTIAQTLAKVVTSVNRVDGVYEKEVAVRMVLIPTTTLVLYPSAPSNSYTASDNNNANTLINKSQTVINANIGSANYDIGHTFSTGGGGLAQLGCVCNGSSKAMGITGSPSPVGDPYDIDYVAHEMGHQFSGNHTFNAGTGSCSGNRNASTSVEPGSGVTIMAYAGICGASDNLSSNSIPYFHAISYDEIVNYTNIGGGNNCALTTTTGNQPPVVTGSGNYIVPVSTPFILNGSATDPNGDALTYSWEETDAGITTSSWFSGTKPYFRSYVPVATPVRFFPKASVVTSSNYTSTPGEYLPSTSQSLQFRLTARDNKMGGGGVCYAINNVTVENLGPLSVFYPNTTGITWYINTTENVMWDVNGTNLAPISCDSVRISISYNSGNTYNVLIPSTPNDGIEPISVPTVSNTLFTCRIKVESRGNIFYDISNFNFTISTDLPQNVGIAEFSRNNPIGLTAWPNPFNNQLNFAAGNLNSEMPTKVSVTDVLGNQLLQTNYLNKSELKESLDFSTLEKGLYFITISNNNKQSSYRIIKN